MLESVGSGPTFSFPPEESPRYPDLFNVPMTPKVIAEQQVRSFLRPQFFFFFDCQGGMLRQISVAVV